MKSCSEMKIGFWAQLITNHVKFNYDSLRTYWNNKSEVNYSDPVIPLLIGYTSLFVIIEVHKASDWIMFHLEINITHVTDYIYDYKSGHLFKNRWRI